MDIHYVDWDGKHFILLWGHAPQRISEQEARHLVEDKTGPQYPCSLIARAQLGKKNDGK